MKQNIPFLKHILDEIDFVINESQKYFLSNEVLKRAFSRSIEIIGEATKNISKDFKTKYNNIEWKEMAGMRDKIIHYYFGINWSIVWAVIKNNLPEIKPKIEAILTNIQ